MPMVVFTYTEGAMPRPCALAVAGQVVESMVRNYAIKSIPDGLRDHTRIKVVEAARDAYVLPRCPDRPIYEVELVVPVDSLTGKDAENFAREVTTAILTAEGSPDDADNAERIWCVFTEVPDGRWAIGRKVMGRKEVLRHVLRYMRSAAVRLAAAE